MGQQRGQPYQTFQSELQSIRRLKWSFGPIKIAPLSLQLNGQYDSNIYGARLLQGPVSDWVTTISVPLNFYLPMRDSLVLYLSETPRYLYFRELAAERSLDNSFSTGFRLLVIDRFVLSASYSHGRIKDHVPSDLDVRIMRIMGGYNASIFYETSRGSSLGFTWSNTSERYEDVTLPGADASLAKTWDREWRSGTIQFNHDIFTDANLFISAGRSDYTFLNPEGSFRDAYSYQVMSGIQFPIVGRASGGIAIGYSRFIPKQEGQRSYSGLIGGSNLGIRLGRFGLRISFAQGTPFSSGQSVYFVDRTYGAGVSFYLTQITRLDYNFSLGGSTYPTSVLLQMPDGSTQEISRRDKLRTHTAGIVFRIIGSTGIGLSATYWERASNYYLASTDRFTIGATITHTF